MNRQAIPLTLLAGGLLALSGQAVAEPGLGIGMGQKAGTLGHGVEVSKSLTGQLNLRLVLNATADNAVETVSGNRYRQDSSWRTIGGLLDYHPLGNGFRISFGYLNNHSELVLSAESATSYDLGGQTYSDSDITSISGTVRFDGGPYIGIGWGNAARKRGLGFLFELGYFVQNESEAVLTVIPTVSGALAHPGIESDIEWEQRAIEDELVDSYGHTPVIAVGLTYSF